MTPSHTQRTNGMAPWSVLEELHNQVTNHLLERFRKGGSISSVFFTLARVLLEQSDVPRRPLTASETAAMVELKELHVQRVLEAMRTEKPAASLIVEARALYESLEDLQRIQAIEGHDVPFNAPKVP